MLQNPNNVDVLIRLIQEAFGAGNLSVVDELIAPDFVEHQFGIQGRGPEAIAHVKAAILDLRRWLPDLTFTIEDTACVNSITGATDKHLFHTSATRSLSVTSPRLGRAEIVANRRTDTPSELPLPLRASRDVPAFMGPQTPLGYRSGYKRG